MPCIISVEMPGVNALRKNDEALAGERVRFPCGSSINLSYESERESVVNRFMKS